MQPLQGFAWIPTAHGDNVSHYVVVANQTKEHHFHIVRLPITYQASFSPSGQIVITGGRSMTVFTTPPIKAADGNNIKHRGRLPPSGDPNLSVIAEDISVVMRERAMAGYSMDVSARNMDVSFYLNLRTAICRLKRIVLCLPIAKPISRNYGNGCIVSPQISGGTVPLVLRSANVAASDIKKCSARDMMRIDGVDYSGQGVQAVIQDMMASSGIFKSFSDTPYC